MKKNVITFIIAYCPIVISSLSIYVFLTWNFFIDEQNLLRYGHGFRHFTTVLGDLLLYHIPLMIVCLLLSFIKSITFLRCRRKHFAFAILLWAFFFLFDPGLKIFLD